MTWLFRRSCGVLFAQRIYFIGCIHQSLCSSASACSAPVSTEILRPRCAPPAAQIGKYSRRCVMYLTRNSCDRPRVSVHSMFLVFVVSALLCCTTGAVAQVEEGPVPGISFSSAWPHPAAFRVTPFCAKPLLVYTCFTSNIRAAHSLACSSNVHANPLWPVHAGKEAYEPTPRFSEVRFPLWVELDFVCQA